MDDSGVGGDLSAKLRVLRSEFLVVLLRFSGLLFEIGVRRWDRTGSFYATSEFVGEVGVFVGQHPAFDVGFDGQLHNGEGPGGALRGRPRSA